MLSDTELKRFATRIRIETLKCLKHRGFGHVGGSMSVIETLAALYGGIMKYDPKNPRDPQRDYFIMSKGHAGPALFATLALQGFFPLDWLETLCEPGTRLPSHCDRLRTPGVDVTTGSLGQGLSIAAGLAQGLHIRRQENWVYVILGDGELAEGQNWEAAQFICQYQLDHVIAFVDWNKRQVDGYVDDIMSPGDIEAKFRAFGWNAATVKGNDASAISKAVLHAKEHTEGRAAAIVLDGVKGSGVPVYEKMFDNHFFALEPEQTEHVIADLEKKLQ